ncbi:MAG: tetratricopeptide repeat protein [Pseudomonadota bacterium]
MKLDLLSMVVDRNTGLKALSAALLLTAAACASPEQKLERYTESGQEFLAKDQLGKANIQFRNALKIKEDHVPALEGIFEIAEERSDYRAMFGILQRIIRVDPNNLRARLDLSKFYLLSGDSTEALNSVDKAIEIAPDNAEAYGVKAAIMFRLENKEEALFLANKALELDPATQEAVTVIATDKVQREEYDEALAVLDDALTRLPQAAVLHLLKVQIFARQNRTEDIGNAYKDLIDAFPEEAAYRRLYASNLIGEKKFDQAREQLMTVTEINKKDLEAYLDVIRLDLEQSGEGKAVQTFDAFIAQRPNNNDLKFAKAAFQRQQGNEADSVAIYQELARLKGDDLEADVLRAKNNLASIALSNEDRPTAEKLISEILDVDERNSSALIKQAGLSLADNDPDTAIRELRLVLSDDPDSVRAKVLMASAFEKNREPAAAQRELSEAFEKNRSNPEVASLYARFLLRNNDVDRAERILNEAIAANADNEENLRLLAAIRLERQDWRGAEEVANLMAKSEESDAIANRIRGAAYTGLQDYAGAIDVLSEENERKPLSARPLATLINAYLQTGRADEAVGLLQGTIEKDADNYDARLLLARVLSGQRKNVEAAEVLRTAIETTPGRAEAYEVLYRTYRRQGQNERALSLLDEGLGKTPDNDGLKVLKADYFISQGDMNSALEIYEDVRTRRPGDLIVANNYAAILTEVSNDTASLKLAAEVAEPLKTSENASFLDTYGWAKYRAGDVEEGITALRRAADLAPNLVDAQAHLGLALAQTGRIAEAAPILQGVIASQTASEALKSAARAALGE